MGVPKTVINETVQFLGAVPEETFVDKVLEAIGKGEAVAESEKPAPSTLL